MRNKACQILGVMFLLVFPVSSPWAAGGKCAEGIPCLDEYEPGKGANDSKTDDPTCDGDFMNQIYARSYMQSERQLVTTQSVLRKPDSVLQYTCFDKLVGVTAREGGSIFSDSEDWKDVSINISVDGGFLGQDFLDAISGFADGLISDLLQGLLPEDLLNVLSQLDSIISLDPEALIQSLSNLSAADITNTLSNLSVDMQMEIHDQILNTVPSDVLNLISVNPASASAEELLLGMQGLPPNVVGSAFVNLPPAQLGSLVSVLPADTLYEIPPQYLSSAMADFSSAEISVFLSNASPEALQSIGGGSVSVMLSSLSPSAMTEVFAAMDSAALVGLMSGMSGSELDQVLSGMSSGAQASLQAEIVAGLPPEVMDLISNNILTASIQDIIGGLQGLDPWMLADLIPGLTLEAFGQLLNGLGTDQLGTLLGGGGSSAAIQLNVFMGEDNLDKSLENIVLASMKDYTDANFGYGMLGGTSDLQSDMSEEIGNGDYNCTAMQDVWQLSKCGNFAGPADPGFQSFSDLSKEDPRQYPQACGGTMITPEMQDIATNKDGKAVQYDDVKDTYVERLGDNPKGSAIICGDPVPLGRAVLIKKVTPSSDLEGGAPTVKEEWVREKACSNPACAYDTQSDTCRVK